MIVIGCVSGIGVSLWKIYSTSKFKVKSWIEIKFIILLRNEKMEGSPTFKLSIRMPIKIPLSNMMSTRWR
jgi:hypothetical protein